MPQAEYVKATENDFYDLVDFLNFVFSHAYQPNNFETMLPGLYSTKNFMSGTNYIVKENGKIVANVGAYPAEYHVYGDCLKVIGITSVAVHPRARSKGYMRKLMGLALTDMLSEYAHADARGAKQYAAAAGIIKHLFYQPRGVIGVTHDSFAVGT